MNTYSSVFSCTTSLHQGRGVDNRLLYGYGVHSANHSIRDGNGTASNGFSNADARFHINCEEQTLCRFGVNFYVNGMSVYEMSRRLPGHYLSSTEAEYYACSIGTCEGTFLVMALTAIWASIRMVLFLSDKTTSFAFISLRIPGGITAGLNTLSSGFVGSRTKLSRRNLR